MKVKLGFGYSQPISGTSPVDTGPDRQGIKNPRSISPRDSLDTLEGHFPGTIKVIHQVSDENILSSENNIISYGPETSVDATLRPRKVDNGRRRFIVQFPIIPIIQEHCFVHLLVNTTVSGA